MNTKIQTSDTLFARVVSQWLDVLYHDAFPAESSSKIDAHSIDSCFSCLSFSLVCLFFFFFPFLCFLVVPHTGADRSPRFACDSHPILVCHSMSIVLNTLPMSLKPILGKQG